MPDPRVKGSGRVPASPNPSQSPPAPLKQSPGGPLFGSQIFGIFTKIGGKFPFWGIFGDLLTIFFFWRFAPKKSKGGRRREVLYSPYPSGGGGWTPPPAPLPTAGWCYRVIRSVRWALFLPIHGLQRRSSCLYGMFCLADFSMHGFVGGGEGHCFVSLLVPICWTYPFPSNCSMLPLKISSSHT